MCFRFWLFLFSVVLVFVLIVYVSAFLFFVVMLALFLVFFCLVLCFVFVFFLVLVSVYEKGCFPCNSGVFFELCWLKGSFGFMFYVFVLVCFSCVVFLSILTNSFVLVCFCVIVFCHKTKWSSCLHLVVLLPFLFFCCFVLNFFFFCFFIPLKKRTPKKPDTATPQKSKNAEKRIKKKLAQLCSQIVFFNFLGWA